MSIVTDLNHRERTRYADALDKASDAARDLAAALRAEDDTTAVLHLVMLSFAYQTLNELGEVFKTAANVAVPDHPPAAEERRAG